jgi:hypothetical protein
VDEMIYIISFFEHSLMLELAITELETHKIPRESILAKPVNKVPREKNIWILIIQTA